MEEDGMSRLVICGDLLLLIRYKLAALLASYADLNKGGLYIFLGDVSPVLLGCPDSCLVEQVLQIGTGKSGSGLSYLRQIDVISQRLVLGMYLQDIFSSPDIG